MWRRSFLISLFGVFCHQWIFAENVIELQKSLKEISDLVANIRLDMMHKVGSLKIHQNHIHEVALLLRSVPLDESPLLGDEVKFTVGNRTAAIQKQLLNIGSSLTGYENITDCIDSLEKAGLDLSGLLFLIDDEVYKKDGPKDVREKILDLTEKLRKKEEEDAIRQLPFDCITAFRSRDFETAETKFNLINDTRKIRLVVSHVYNGQATNFPPLIDFAKRLRKIDKSLKLLGALWGEMNSHGHFIVEKQVTLLQTLKTEVINQENASQKVKSEAKRLLLEMEEQLKVSLQSKMKDAMLAGRYNDAKFKVVLNAAYLYNFQIFLESIEKVLEEVYPSLSFVQMMNYVSDHDYLNPAIYGVIEVYKKMKSLEELQNPAVVRLAFLIKEFESMENYPTVSEEVKSKMAEMKDSLPLCIKTAAFASKVCIRNVEVNEYLYAPGDDYQYDDQRRTILTWIPESRIANGVWKVKPHDDLVYLKNIERDEYLYAANYQFDDSRRRVFSWRKKEKVTQGTFFIEPAGDNCYIKNKLHNEYLQADLNVLDKDRRYVSTAISGEKTERSLWALEDCSRL